MVFLYPTEGNRRLSSPAVAMEAVGVHEMDASGHTSRAGAGDIFDAASGRSCYAGALARFFRIAAVQRDDCALAHLGNPLAQQSPQSAFVPVGLGHSLAEGTAVTGMLAA